MPNAAITTDLMVGFPGESEKCFADTYSLAQKVGFSDMHIFEYSKREGTVAAALDGQVPASVKTKRSKALRCLANKMRTDYMEKQVGKTLQVLFEEDLGQGFYQGLCKEYLRTVVYSELPLTNTVRDIKITGVNSGKLEGKIIAASGL